ncbi:MAG: amino acid transporter substrate-binding protein [Proteobacteria bacterium]|nr:amino acid transporter substrate-binding protein [Pseudomonadota bacterium]
MGTKSAFFARPAVAFAGPVRACCAALVLLSCSAQAIGTLEKITQTGTVTLGYRDSSPPFSYLNDNRRPIGYSLDLCLKVVDALKHELKRSDLAVKFAPVSSASRIAALTSGEVDLECGSTTSTAERSKQVAFTIPTFLAATRLMVRQDSGIRSLTDLAGKTVVTTKGTSSESLFDSLNQGRTLRATLLLGKDHFESFSMLEAGKADAFIMDDVLLYSLRAAAKDPAKFVITNDALTIEPLSLMLRKDDPAFKKVVDSEITRIIVQGEINAIYHKWFESPIPPQQINLKLPMSYILRDSFKTPADWVPH